MRRSYTFRSFTLVALKVGVIVFLSGFFFEIRNKLILVTPSWTEIAKAVLFLLFASVSVFLLILDKRRFSFIGYFLVFVVSVFRLFSILFSSGPGIEITTHFLLTILSLYLISRPLVLKHHKGNDG